MNQKRKINHQEGNMRQKSYKKLYSIHEYFIAVYNGLRTKKYLNKAKKSNELGIEFIERIMLAVTEVNGCELCTYAHTKWALEAGMSNEEIQKILSGVTDGISADEISAIMFAQHYADTKGNPSKESWEHIIKVYGPTKANGILGAIREMMIGNIFGASASAFYSRLKGNPYNKSNPLKEMGIVLSTLVFYPIAFIGAGISSFLRTPIISF